MSSISLVNAVDTSEFSYIKLVEESSDSIDVAAPSARFFIARVDTEILPGLNSFNTALQFSVFVCLIK